MSSLFPYGTHKLCASSLARSRWWRGIASSQRVIIGACEWVQDIASAISKFIANAMDDVVAPELTRDSQPWLERGKMTPDMDSDF